MNKLNFLKVYNSPFKFFLPKLYIGRTAIGVPYFLPRVWKTIPSKEQSDPTDRRVRISRPKKIGFDFTGLGYKLKWSETDFRFEWSPVWSFVFFGYQVALTFVPPHLCDYWALWYIYEHHTNPYTTRKARIAEAKKIEPSNHTVWNQGGESEYCGWDLVLKKRYLK